MPQINIKIRNKIATNESDVAYVCGNSDFVIVFDFDDEWLDYDVKTARFKYNGTYQDIIFHGNQIDVPVIENTYKIYIGVYAGDLHTTTPAVLNAKKSILSGSGTPIIERDDVYSQLMQELNNQIGLAEDSEKAAAQSAKEAADSAREADAAKQEVQAALDTKVDKVSGKGLSTNDYTNEDKAKLDSVELDANYTRVDTALSSISTNPVQNKVIYNELGSKVDREGATMERYASILSEDEGVRLHIRPQNSGDVEFHIEDDFGADEPTYQYVTLNARNKMIPKFTRGGLFSGEKEEGFFYTELNPPTTINGFSFASMTQAEYDALETKDENTIYLVV